MTNMVLERLTSIGTVRITLDFDGTVISTGRWAEGSAVGFRKKRLEEVASATVLHEGATA